MGSELIAGKKDGPGPYDYRGIWAWPDIGSSYLHVETPNSSAPDRIRWCGDPAIEVSPCFATGLECNGANTARRRARRSEVGSGVGSAPARRRWLLCRR